MPLRRLLIHYISSAQRTEKHSQKDKCKSRRLIHHVKKTASDWNERMTPLNSGTNSLMHCVIKCSLLYVMQAVTLPRLTKAVCAERSVLQTCKLDSTWLDSADTSPYAPSCCPYTKEYPRYCSGALGLTRFAHVPVSDSALSIYTVHISLQILFLAPLFGAVLWNTCKNVRTFINLLDCYWEKSPALRPVEKLLLAERSWLTLN